MQKAEAHYGCNFGTCDYKFVRKHAVTLANVHDSPCFTHILWISVIGLGSFTRIARIGWQNLKRGLRKMDSRHLLFEGEPPAKQCPQSVRVRIRRKQRSGIELNMSEHMRTVWFVYSHDWLGESREQIALGYLGLQHVPVDFL